MPLPQINSAALLADIPLFNGLAPGEIARLARSCREIELGKGEILFHKGDPCNGFHFVVHGQIKLALTSAQGNEKVVEIIRPGQSFGEAIMFMDKSHIVFAQALADSLLLHVAKSGINEELERDPGLCRKMLAGMARRLHQLMNDVESYSLLSARQRVIGYLLREVPVEPENDGARVIRLANSKGIVASRLNLTQEHFSRVLHGLSELGLIVIDGRKIHLPDLARLRQYQD